MAGPVQTATATGTSGTLTATFGSNTTAGNTIVVYFGAISLTSGTTVSSIALTGSSDTFTKENSIAGNNVDGEIWIDNNCSGGHTAVVVTPSFGVGTPMAIVRAEEWAGIATSSPLDTHPAGATAGSGTTFTSNATGTLAQPNELIVGLGFAGNGSAPSLTGPGGGWTNQPGESTSTGGTHFSELITGWIEPNATTSQTYSGTNTQSERNCGLIISLKLTAVTVNLPVIQTTDNVPALTMSPVTVNIPAVQTSGNAPALTPASPPVLIIAIVPVAAFDPLTAVVCNSGFTDFTLDHKQNVNLQSGAINFNNAGQLTQGAILAPFAGDLILQSGGAGVSDNEASIFLISQNSVASAGLPVVDVIVETGSLQVNGTNMTVP